MSLKKVWFVPFDINDRSLAKAYPPNQKNKGVIEISCNENWNFRTSTPTPEGKNYYSPLSAATHETGHALV